MPFVSMPEPAKSKTYSLSPSSQTIQPSGPRDAKIAFVSNHPSTVDIRNAKPLMGEAGTVFDHCLHQAELIRSNCFVTTLSPEHHKYSTAYISDSGKLNELGRTYMHNLADQLNALGCSIIVTLGAEATRAVTGQGELTKRRGYITTATDLFNNALVMPTLNPSSVIYGGNYINKYYITHDLVKVRKLLERNCSDIYDNVSMTFPTTVGEVFAMFDTLQHAHVVAFDIEVTNYEVSHISFAASADHSFSILFNSERLWSADDEVMIWDKVAELLGNPAIAKCGQNLIFDIHFLLSHMGIKVRGNIIDTMIGHHITYPDFLKGLGFLASIYTNQRYWKDKMSFGKRTNNVEKGDG